MIKVELIGIPEFKKMMAEKQANIQRILPESIRKAVLYLHARIKESIARGINAPVAVDTGRFLNSIDFDVQGQNGRIFTDIEYAQFIEYGTIFMAARPHFRNTVNVEKQKIREEMGADIKSI